MPVYRGDGPWGFGKGSPLTASEGDGNIFDLQTRIAALESATGQNPIAGLSVSPDGTLLTFTFTDGTTAGITIPIAAFHFRNNWAATTVYDQLDTFKVDLVGLYLVLVSHTSDSVFDEDAVDVDSNPLYFKLFGFSDATARYSIGCYVPGVMANSQPLLYHRFSKAVTLPADFAAYLGHASEAGGIGNATGSTVIDVAKGTPGSFSTVGSIIFGAGGTTPTFATSGGTAKTFAQGDVIRLRGPATADATFSDFFATLTFFETPA